MKRVGIRFVFALFLITAALLSTPAYSKADTGRQMAYSAVQALGAQGTVVWTQNTTSLSWTLYEVTFNYKFEDGTSIPYPITVDFLGSNFSTPKGVVYLLPGGGMNFKSSFFTPIDDNLAQYFRNAGYLVVGITPREDRVPSTDPTYSCMANWGMDRHVNDIGAVISAIQNSQAFSGKKFRILGHSFGASYALDYVGRYDCPLLEKVIALDIYKVDEAAVAEHHSMEYFYDPYATFGSYGDASYASIKSLLLISALLPDVISTESHDEYFSNGTDWIQRYFTYEGFLYFSMIESARLESVWIGDWPLKKGYVAGTYTIRSMCNPYLDTYSFAYLDINTLRSSSLKLGSGVVPFAVYRDYFAANTETYKYIHSINWTLPDKVLWINTQYGYGDQLISSENEPMFLVNPIPGLGHLDVLMNNSYVKNHCWKYLVQ